MIRQDVEADLEAIAKKHGRTLKNLDNAPVKASPGDYWIYSEDNTARLHVRVRDPRQSEEAGKFTVELSFPKSAQAEMKKIPDAKTRFEQFAKGEEIDSLKWETGYPWSKALTVNPDAVEDTVTEIADAIRALYAVIVQYEQWIATSGTR